MNVADRIGLLPGFGWLADHNFWVTLLICIVLTPIGHLLVGIIGESRWVPIGPKYQFTSFFPGDLFLGVMVAGLLTMAHKLPDKSRWYNGTTWHVLVLVGAAVVACLMTYMEWKGGIYSTRAIFSPTKLYHNGLLYIGYGYAIVTMLVAVLVGRGLDWTLTLVLLPGLVWVMLVVRDSTLKPEQAREKAKYAHVDDWSFIFSPF